jgi:hypothetical protein
MIPAFVHRISKAQISSPLLSRLPAILLALILFFCGTAISSFAQDSPEAGASTILHDVRPGPGVTKVAWLSEWFPPLGGSPVDTRVFILEGSFKGDTVFVLGGTHENEIAGIMTALLLVERARVLSGRLIVITNGNNSAATWNERAGEPAWIALSTGTATRFFKYGSRLTNPVHQMLPDPDWITHGKSGEVLPGYESRNLNRAYPGKPDGSLTEKLAFAIMTLIRKEDVHIAFDLHEAGPESRLANMIVANPKNLDSGALAKLDLEFDGIRMSLEPSSENFRGLSHREWGDHSQAAAFLIETPNPGQGNTTIFDTVGDPTYPLSLRVATHLATIEAILAAHSLIAGSESPLILDGVPQWRDIVSLGLGHYLR